ncbi:hypothetical protein LINPERPRIM_LOCUS9292 [Linum perenne]
MCLHWSPSRCLRVLQDVSYSFPNISKSRKVERR